MHASKAGALFYNFTLTSIPGNHMWEGGGVVNNILQINNDDSVQAKEILTGVKSLKSKRKTKVITQAAEFKVRERKICSPRIFIKRKYLL